jgi:ABC-2 type transport system ATP-binding protein
VPELPGAVGVAQYGAGAVRSVLVHTRDLQRTLTALLGWASCRGWVLQDLSTRPASLEEAFLAVAESETADAAGQEEVA